MFNPCLLIADHFDEITNKIDIRTETILLDQSLWDTSRNELNALRECQLNKIKECQEINLKNFERFREDVYLAQWSTVMDDPLLSHEQKVEQIKEKIIAIDCALLEDERVFSGLNLCTIPWFLNEKNLEFLK